MSMFLAILLAWDLSVGATGYKIYWRFTDDEWGGHVVDVGNVRQAEINEPWANGSKLQFRCTAHNATGESAPSNIVEWRVTGKNN
jgi:hypothetical protein